MNQINIVAINNLNVGDRLIRDKIIGYFTKHHGIYVGIHKGIPMVAENQAGCGVRYVTLEDFLSNDYSTLKRIERFSGSLQARKNIIPRVNKLLGKAYDVVNFNCEHFANLIQNGAAKSKQADTAVAIAGFAAFVGLIALVVD